MRWLVFVVLSYLDRELAVRAAVSPSRGRPPERGRGGAAGDAPFARAESEAERRGPGGPPEARTRSKRGFTYPGTLWCGAGNMADHDEQLGEFEETDRCCRTHDHCPHVIHAFSSKYGYANFKWYSICHCDCDEALRGCLRRVNDTSSRVVGQAFFNVIGAPCFDFVFEEQCAERHWYGLCKRYEKLPVAVVKEAIPYDYGGIAVIDVLTRAPPERKDDNKQESATQATLYGPEGPSLGNMVSAAEDFIKVLATVSSTSTADSDKDSQSSEMKKKKKDNAKKKKKKKKKKRGKGWKRKQKEVQVQERGTVSPSGGKTQREDVPVTNFITDHQTGTQRLSEGQTGPSNDIMKDEPLTETAKSTLTPGETSSPSRSPPRKGRNKEKVPLTSPEEISQLAVDSTDNFPGVLKSQQHPVEEIPQPDVDSTENLSVIPTPMSLKRTAKIFQPVVDYIDTLSVTTSMAAEETGPTPGSLSKTRPPRKGRRKEKALATSPEEIPQFAADSAENPSATSIPTIVTSQQHPNKQIPQPAPDFIDNLSVTTPQTPEEISPPGGSPSKHRRPRQGKRKEKELVTSPKEIPRPAVNTTDNLHAIVTSQLERQRLGEIFRPSVDSAANSIIILASQPGRKHPDEEIPQSVIESIATSIPAIGISQHVVDSTGNLSATSIPTSQRKQQRPVEGRPVLGPPGTPNVTRNQSQEKGDKKGRKKKRKVRLDSGAQSTTPGLTANLAQSPDFVTAGVLKVSVPKRQRSREGGRRNKRTKATSENALLKSLTTTTPPDPVTGDTRRTKPKKPGRKATSTDIQRGLSISEVPGLTLTPAPAKERVGQSRSTLPPTLKMSAMQRSMERAREQFARKKGRKAALVIRPH
ncbi:serine/arginine repetitive matrix protein 2 [Phycodurus eques]|uniref:serine/arginine repetitive matrix protein 2 n=1 Tax=Phycodurus eques TaxID=693459 RepID=UPI002ACDCDFF|nr:serine/arginine repetitive matrix protein 2 [Phycodurus eques]